MTNPIINSKRIFIIGNADNQIPIEQNINPDDFIVRFNKPNPTCPLKANLLFIANGPVVVARRTKIFNNMMKDNCHIMWRYSRQDILSSKYEKISLSRKLRYLLFLAYFKKINHLNNNPESIINEILQEQCTRLVQQKIPSSGFLIIFLFQNLYPNIPIYIHNFTFSGWDGHNWEEEERIVKQWLQQEKIFLASSLTQN